MTINNESHIPMNIPAYQTTRGATHGRNGSILPNQQPIRGGAGRVGGNPGSPGSPGKTNGAGSPGNTGGAGFAQILDQAAKQGAARTHGKPAALKISKHAEARLHDRNIQLSGTQKEKIADALQKADNKGVREALVMIDGLAIVANTKSMTVITAVSEGDLRQNIFTNIDGAVFA